MGCLDFVSIFLNSCLISEIDPAINRVFSLGMNNHPKTKFENNKTKIEIEIFSTTSRLRKKKRKLPSRTKKD